MSENLRERFAELPANLSAHVQLSILAVLLGVVISVPLAVLLTRRAHLRYPVLTVAGVIQTVPSLALLALMVPVIVYTGGLFVGLSAFGFYPAIIALTMYSILPILRNTVTGILEVDPELREAAIGLGMTDRQLLWKVELPLAAPVILAGIRTAVVWVVGTATLATPVGQRCLGNYIFTGLQTRNWIMVLFGVVAAAGLAVIVDLCVAGLERASRHRRPRLAIAVGAVLILLIAGALVAPGIARSLGQTTTPSVALDDAGAGEASVRQVRIGAKTFTEQYILADVMAQRLRAAGIDTTLTDSLGSTVIFDALANGDIDVYVDYTGTVWANYMKESETEARWRVMARTSGWLAREHGIRNLGSLGFENAYALAVRRQTAEELGLETIEDLSRHAPELVVGGDYEFFGRPEWRAIRAAYQLRFADKLSMDSTLMYEALAAGKVDVISAFSSDGRIAAYDLKVLSDPRGVIPPYDAIVLLSSRVAADQVVLDALQPLIGAISVDEMRRANLMVDQDRDKHTARQAASWLLEQIGLSP